MASISGRVNEANKFLENGHKFMKTSLLKWSPDYDNAANQFQQAAMVFKGAGLHQKAIEANELAIKCYLNCQNSGFYAAKCMEQAALSSKELGDIQSVSRYYMRAIDIYRNQGQLDTAISTMERAAKAITEKMPTLAADIYIQASEACAVEDRYRQAAEYCNKAANLYLKSKNFGRAADIAKEELNCYSQAGATSNYNRIAIGIILAYLADNNIVGAHGILKSCQMDEETSVLAHGLVTGYDKKDSKLLRSTLDNSFFRNLDTEYAKVARGLLETHGQDVEEANASADGVDELEENALL